MNTQFTCDIQKHMLTRPTGLSDHIHRIDLLAHAHIDSPGNRKKAFTYNRSQADNMMYRCKHVHSPAKVQFHFLMSSRRRAASAGKLIGRPRPSRTTPSAPPATFIGSRGKQPRPKPKSGPRQNRMVSFPHSPLGKGKGSKPPYFNS